MNKTDRVTVQYADAYYQSAIKWIDDFILKYKSSRETPGAGGAQVFEAVDGRSDLDKVIGALNTIVMKIQDRIGLALNWDQGAITYTQSYVPENDDNTGVLRDRNINDKMA